MSGGLDNVTRATPATERATGIEPAFSAWEADVLPLNYTREGAHCRGTSCATAAVFTLERGLVRPA